MLKPRHPVPPLSVQTVSGDVWTLNEPAPGNFTMLVFYRGWHCPICRRTLAELNSRLDAFEQRGVRVLALSMDNAERAGISAVEWQLDRLTIGYGLDLETVRAWNQTISMGRACS